MLLFYLLIVTMAGASFPQARRFAALAFGLFWLYGLGSGLLLWPAVLATIALGMMVFLLERQRFSTFWGGLLIIVVLVLSLLLFAHKIPGFHNVLVWDGLHLSAHSAPLRMFLNFDKPLFAVCYLLLSSQTLTGQSSLRRQMQALGLTLIPLLALVVPLGLWVEYINFAPKFPAEFWLWALNNLFLVCIGEEVFFRGFIQKKLSQAFAAMPYGHILALALASLAFGLVHFAGGWGFVGLATVAGLFYGLAYQKAQSLEAAIACHFLLNMVHFLGFTYPFYWERGI